MIKAIINALTGNVAQSLADAYAARHNATTEQERIAAEVTIARIEATRNRGRLFDWLVFIVALPLALHVGAVAFVSAFPAIGWTVHALPPPMNDWQGQILLSLFGLSAVVRVVR